MFLDYPLGHTAGRVDDNGLKLAIVAAALTALSVDEPGRITDLPYHWAETDAWKDEVMRVDVGPTGEATTVDDRVERFATPQYQTEADAIAAAHRHEGLDCEVCPGVDS